MNSEMAERLLDEYDREFQIDTMVDGTTVLEKMYEHAHVKGKWIQRMRQHQARKLKMEEELEDFVREETVREKQLGKISQVKVQNKINNKESAREIKRSIKWEEHIIWHLDAIVKEVQSLSFRYQGMVEMLKLEGGR